MPPRFIARQLSCPSGVFGGIMGLLMNRHNAKMNRFVVRQLQLAPNDHVLEIGFGGGVNLHSLIAGAVFVAGVDPSQVMVRQAKARFAEAVSAGRADFRAGSVEELPFEGSSFGKVCTVNTIYFWKSLDTGFAEIHRVLSPGGCLIVGFLPKERMDRMGMPTDIFTTRAPEEVDAALKSAGFMDVRVERPKPTTPWVCVDHPRLLTTAAIGFSYNSITHSGANYTPEMQGNRARVTVARQVNASLCAATDSDVAYLPVNIA